MIAVIRIQGQVNVKKDIKEAFKRLGLKTKYNCILLEPTKENLGMIKQLRDKIAYGEINEETLKQLKEKRKTKKDNFFRLHPPRGGIKSKLHFPKGILGDNKDKINDLIKRML
jgi:ribosomal protein L30/L7E